MTRKGIIAIYSFFLVLSFIDCDDYLVQNVTRKLCPPVNTVPQPKNRIDTSEQLKKLREEMGKVKSVQGPTLDAYIITRYDEHLNDFVSDHDKRLEYISGFSGIYGIAAITKTEAAFWTDHIHATQANNELSCEWTLFKSEYLSMTSVAEWLSEKLQVSVRVGADPKLMPNNDWDILARAISAPKSLILFPTPINLIDLIWTSDRPDYSEIPAYEWKTEFAGLSFLDKLNIVREAMNKSDCDALIISSMSEIGWLLNIRGADSVHRPFLRTHVVLTKDQLHLFANSSLLPETVRSHLKTESCVSSSCTRLHEYSTFWLDFRKLILVPKKVCLPSMSQYNPGISRFVFSSVPVDKRKIIPRSLLIDLMAVKNKVEREGMRTAHMIDAAVFSNFTSYIETELLRFGSGELAMAIMLDSMRWNQDMVRGISYPSTVAAGVHSSIPQYVPTNETSVVVNENELVVIDSGAHYWCGTTALARTIYFSRRQINEEYIMIYTRLVMGLIDFASLSFPPNLNSNQLDVIARNSLWQIGYESPFGSGHGIGIFSDVYEAPIDINYKNSLNDTLKDGYFIVAENGYYKEDVFGIKLSMVLEVMYKNDSSGYLKFEPVTMVPFETTLINASMLTTTHKMWLNEYYTTILSTVGRDLQQKGLNNAFNWLADRTDPFPLTEEKEDNSASQRHGALGVALGIILLHVLL